MVNCPCCDSPMLRHVRDHQVFWFCRHCWLEMPIAEQLHVLSQAAEPQPQSSTAENRSKPDADSFVDSHSHS